MDLSNPSITGIKLIFCHNPSGHAFRASEARPGIQEQRNWFPAFAGTMSGFPPSRSCRHVIARDGNDRSNLISSRIHEITTTPERRLVTCDLKGYDKEELRHSLPFKGGHTLVIRYSACSGEHALQAETQVSQHKIVPPAPDTRPATCG